jgi:hypothetical protein
MTTRTTRTTRKPKLVHFVAASFLLAAPLAVGCGTADDGTGDEQDVVPSAAQTFYEQAGVCDAILKRHATVRATDLKDGTIRWNCGDVPGVTSQDRGQEYCEYNAVSGGKRVTKFSDVKANAPVQCVFTGVYSDVTGKDTKLEQSLSAKENLNAKVTDKNMVRMQKGFNSRGAATALIDDCQAGYEQPIDEARQAACYEASLAKPANAKKLATACKGKDLSVDANWKKAVALGAKVAVPGDADYEAQRDISACLRTHVASPATWRNSDPQICGRVVRGRSECSCNYVDVPNAVEGFTFTGWTNDQLPTGCRYAKVDGKDYAHLVICEASASELEDLQLKPEWSGDLQAFCHDRFSTELVMKAPLRALEKPGTCKPDANAFCKAYSGK